MKLTWKTFFKKTYLFAKEFSFQENVFTAIISVYMVGMKKNPQLFRTLLAR